MVGINVPARKVRVFIAGVGVFTTNTDVSKLALDTTTETQTVEVLISGADKNVSGFGIGANPAKPTINKKIVSDNTADTEAYSISQFGIYFARSSKGDPVPVSTVPANLCFDTTVPESP